MLRVKKFYNIYRFPCVLYKRLVGTNQSVPRNLQFIIFGGSSRIKICFVPHLGWVRMIYDLSRGHRSAQHCDRSSILSAWFEYRFKKHRFSLLQNIFVHKQTHNIQHNINIYIRIALFFFFWDSQFTIFIVRSQIEISK